MKRKVVKHGPSTFIVSLPSKWVNKYGIAKGDEVDVEEKGKSLLVSPNVVRDTLEISQDVSGLMPSLVDSFLARSYQKGYDKIYLTYDNLNILETIRKKVHELIGYEIIEQDNKSCLIKSIASRIELDFDSSLSRAFLIVRQMSEDCFEAYKEDDKDKLKNIDLKDLEVNRLCHFCLRHINKEQYIDSAHSHQTHILYSLIDLLESLGDCYKTLAIILSKTKKRNKELLNILTLLIRHFEVSYSYFYKPTKDKANVSSELYMKVENAIEKVAEKNLDKEEVLSIILMKNAADLAYQFTITRLDFLKEEKKN